MLRGIVIGAGCALGITSGALALTGGSTPDHQTAAARQYGGCCPVPPLAPPPPQPPPLIQPPPAPPPPPPGAVQPIVQVQQIAILPSNKKCLSRRNFNIRLRSPNHEKLVSGTVFVNGKQVVVAKGKRLRSGVNLRGLPKGRYSVKIVVTTKSGKKFHGTRRYRTCNKKLKGGIPRV